VECPSVGEGGHTIMLTFLNCGHAKQRLELHDMKAPIFGVSRLPMKHDMKHGRASTNPVRKAEIDYRGTVVSMFINGM
jgi:hypothetical protein